MQLLSAFFSFSASISIFVHIDLLVDFPLFLGALWTPQWCLWENKYIERGAAELGGGFEKENSSPLLFRGVFSSHPLILLSFRRQMPRILSGDPMGSWSANKRGAVHKEQTGKTGLRAVRRLGHPINRLFAKDPCRTKANREITTHGENNMATTN